VHTGFNALTGEDLPAKDLFSYSWINGRGAFVFARFAGAYTEFADELMTYAGHVVESIERIRSKLGGSIPFGVPVRDGSRLVLGRHRAAVHARTYGDLFSCLGLLEYGVRAGDKQRIALAEAIYDEVVEALKGGSFVNEPSQLDVGFVSENFWSTALDVANEFYHALGSRKYLDLASGLAQTVINTFYRPEERFVREYVRPGGTASGPHWMFHVTDPGHAIEFAGFCLILREAAVAAGVKQPLIETLGSVAPTLIHSSLESGWNPRHGGIFKTIDVRTGRPIDALMPWWSLPEAMLSTWLAYEMTADAALLEWYRRVHDTYFLRYLNPITRWAPYQTIDGKTGLPVDSPPACPFQDPDYHSARNIHTMVRRLRSRLSRVRGAIEWRST
jgi:hypothetical protein